MYSPTATGSAKDFCTGPPPKPGGIWAAATPTGELREYILQYLCEPLSHG
ncbi:MAG: hypothetical protein PVG96_18130 [Desulfobacterales bacterium]